MFQELLTLVDCEVAIEAITAWALQQGDVMAAEVAAAEAVRIMIVIQPLVSFVRLCLPRAAARRGHARSRA